PPPARPHGRVEQEGRCVATLRDGFGTRGRDDDSGLCGNLLEDPGPRAGLPDASAREGATQLFRGALGADAHRAQAVATTLGAAPPAGERPAPRARRGAVLAQPERPRAARAAGDRAAPGARDDGDVAAPGHLDEHGTARKSVEHRTVRGGGDARVGARSFARELLARE